MRIARGNYATGESAARRMFPNVSERSNTEMQLNRIREGYVFLSTLRVRVYLYTRACGRVLQN